MKNRENHLQWSKDRAYKYIENGDRVGAYSSFISDMKKHPETENDIGLELGLMLVMAGKLNTLEEIKDWIDGFN